MCEMKDTLRQIGFTERSISKETNPNLAYDFLLLVREDLFRKFPEIISDEKGEFKDKDGNFGVGRVNTALFDVFGIKFGNPIRKAVIHKRPEILKKAA